MLVKQRNEKEAKMSENSSLEMFSSCENSRTLMICETSQPYKHHHHNWKRRTQTACPQITQSARISVAWSALKSTGTRSQANSWSRIAKFNLRLEPVSCRDIRSVGSQASRITSKKTTSVNNQKVLGNLNFWNHRRKRLAPMPLLNLLILTSDLFKDVKT